jgi:hypothetical protein
VSAAQDPSLGRVVECTADMPRLFFDLLLPGHFKVRLQA